MVKTYNIMYRNVLTGHGQDTPRLTFPNEKGARQIMWTSCTETQRNVILWTRHVLWRELRWGVEILRAVHGGEANCKVRIKTLVVSLVISN